MSYVRREYPEKSWSNSRSKTFEECKRKYYYEYYASHNGWEKEASKESKEAHMFKQLDSIHLLVGNLLHQQFGKAVDEINQKKDNLFICPEDMRVAVLSESRKIIKISKSEYGKKDFIKYPKGTHMLQEYYLGTGITTEEGEKIKQKVENCIENFFMSSTYDIVSADPQIQILEIDTSAFDTYLLVDNVKVYFKVDLLYYQPSQGKYYIVDWKTGAYNEKDKQQLLMYAYYVHKTYDVPANKIIARIEYVENNEKYELTFMEDEINSVEKIIQKALEEMETCLEDSDLNKPKNIDYFSLNQCGGCKSCKYRMLCNKV